MHGTQALQLLAALLSLAELAAAQPALRFEPAAVVASGMSAGGEVVWLGVGRIPLGSSQGVLTHREVTSADGSGEASVEVAAGVPWRSVWAAVDLATGAYAVGTPPEYPLREAVFAPEAFEPGPAGGPARIFHLHRRVELLVVRQGVGAWGLSAADGGPGDGDGRRDGSLETGLGGLEGLASGAAAPVSLLAGDVVVVLDPERMNLTAARLAMDAPGGGG